MMFKHSALLLLLSCATTGIFAQSDIPAERKIKLFRYSSPDPLEVDITELKNTSIVFTSVGTNEEGAAFYPETLEIPIPDIDYLKYRTKNDGATRFMIGGLIGFGTGGLIGLLMGNDKPCTVPTASNSGNMVDDLSNALAYVLCKGTRTTAGEKAVLLGAPLGLIGGIIGARSPSITISIKGKKENYYRKLKNIRNLME